ncbi:MAG TPA: signal peptidase I [Terrimesophilobacter sp.]|nr:signal peptidase I [Terrimesophilobacter sp.]
MTSKSTGARHASARSEARTEKKPKGLLHYLGVGVSAGLLALVLLIGAMAIVVPAITGSTPMTILSGSMTPTYPIGTLIIVKPVDPDTLAIGDTITYQIESGKPAVVTHRIIVTTARSDGTRTFTTQGDANNAPDAKQVFAAQIRGKVWYSIPYLGWVNTWVNGEGRNWLIPVIAAGLFLYAGYMGASGIAGALRRRERETAEVIEPDSAVPAEEGKTG